MTVKKNKPYDEYLLSNQQFLNRVYTVIFPVSIQIIQKEQDVSLIFSRNKKLLVDGFTLEILNYIEKELTLEEIFKLTQNKYPNADDRHIILIITKAIKKLSINGFVKQKLLGDNL